MSTNKKSSIVPILIMSALTCLVVLYTVGISIAPKKQESIGSNSVSLSIQIEPYSPPLGDLPEVKERSEVSEVTEKDATAQVSVQATAQVDSVEGANDSRVITEQDIEQGIAIVSEDVFFTPEPSPIPAVQPPLEMSDKVVVEEEVVEEPESVDDGASKSEQKNPKRSVRIFDEGNGEYVLGDTIVLLSKLVGFSDSVVYQWQVDKGNGWRDINGANGASYHFVYSEDNCSYTWRLVVTEVE